MGPLHAEIAGHARRGEGEVANDSWDGDEVSLALDAGGDLPWRAGALVRWARAELGIPFDFAGTPTPARRQESDALSVALPLGWNGGDWELEGHLARSEADLALTDPGDPFAASDSEARRDQARLLLRAESAPGITWTAGGDWEEARVSSGSAFGPGLQRQEQGSWALFAQGSFARGTLRLDAGVRRDEVDSFGGQTSLRAAAAVALGERGRLRAAYGESFRAPSLADLYYPGFSNPALAPERVESAELAAELEAGPARAELVLFRNELDDLIEFDYGTFRPENIGRARAEGVELALALKLAALDARLALTWLEAEDRATGRPLLRRPEESASLVAFYRPGRVTVGVVASYVGDRVDFGEVPLPSHETLDLSLAFRAHERFEPFARVENVSDERYEEAAGFPAPGRTWAAGCALRF
jgi:vitamin B12 transporter